jgi:hypothetical protein
MRVRLISFFQICKAKKEIYNRKQAVQTIQRAWKKHVDHSRLLAAFQIIRTQVRCIVRCQSIVRRYFACKELFHLKQERKNVIKIQSVFRMHRGRTFFLLKRASVRLLQAVWRKYQVKQLVYKEYLLNLARQQYFAMTMQMASKIQTWYRWKKFTHKLHITLQSLHSFVVSIFYTKIIREI